MTSRQSVSVFWSIRNFILTRNPELLDEYTALFHKNMLEVAHFLDSHYPRPEGSWTEVSMGQAPALIRELYPHGKH